MSKSPKVSEARLSGLLNDSGFRSASRWYGSYAWNRWNSMLGVSEWILIGFAGQTNEAVSANVGVGITRTLAFGLSYELLMDLADVTETFDKYGSWLPGRGRAIIETSEQAKAWERRLADIAPAAAECYALKHSDELLKQTAHARQRSVEILQQLDFTKSLGQQIQELESRYGHAYRQEAERLAEWPGVMQIFDAEEIYLLACYAVLTGEQGTTFIGQDPLSNEELMWQIQLVADGILSWTREAETTH